MTTYYWSHYKLDRLTDGDYLLTNTDNQVDRYHYYMENSKISAITLLKSNVTHLYNTISDELKVLLILKSSQVIFDTEERQNREYNFLLNIMHADQTT